ncbi:hypothetical protein RSOLAG1IB_05935 [Rhizoctonia solani AG-1 IB]|uniref:Uncharacterized protein n=1 Tax=Thanatephorus cucumeris (strain AG1-IB / isolate 7/3/14) TaxID=1108050 RepID=A0A0B7F9E9_THACB|nr:hypothetical protein RSOLAG1IB_05935 [Rhizoctonia solani AG-1 IB]
MLRVLVRLVISCQRAERPKNRATSAARCKRERSRLHNAVLNCFLAAPQPKLHPLPFLRRIAKSLGCVGHSLFGADRPLASASFGSII